MGDRKKQTKEKTLEEMTSVELRKEAMDIPDITGVHGMNKIELISAIKQAKGIKDDSNKRSNASVREIKQKIKVVKTKRDTALKEGDAKMTAIYKRRVIRLKKKSRRA